MSIGDSISGVLAAADSANVDARPSQRFVLATASGGAVTVELESVDFDAYLRTENEQGLLLAEDNDTGVETDARLLLDLDPDEACVLIVSAKAGAGEFTLSAHAGERPTLTDAALADAGSVWRHRAAERALARGDKGAAATHRLHEGHRHSSLSHLGKALEAYESSLALARELDDRSLEAQALWCLGNLDYELNDFQGAGELYEQHLALVRELGDRASEARVLGDLANTSCASGDFVRARERYLELLALARELGDRQSEAWALANLGNVACYLGDYPRAKSELEQSLAVARAIEAREEEAWALGNLGNVNCYLGDYGRALEQLEQSLAMTRDLGDRAGEARMLGNLAHVHYSLGDYPSALEQLEQGLAIESETGNRAGEAPALGNLGIVHEALGDYPRAQQYYEQQLALVLELGDRAAQVTVLGNLGNVYLAIGDHSRAKEHYEQYLALNRELGIRSGEAMALGNLGGLALALGDYPRARELHEQHLAIAREIGDRLAEAKELVNLSETFEGLGDYPRARELASAADALARELGARTMRIDALMAMATTALALRDSAAARAALEEAEGLVEELPLAGLEHGQAGRLRGRFSSLGRAAQDLAALQLTEASEERAERDHALHRGFADVGRWKGRSLLEGIAEHRAGARSLEAIELCRLRKVELAGYAAVLERVSSAIQAERPHAEVEELRALARARREEAERLAERLRAVSPADAALDLPIGAGPEEVRHALLGPRDLLVEYVEGRERLYAYALGSTGFELLDLGLRKEIATELGRFLGGIRDPGRLEGPGEVAATGHALFQRLLAPALTALGPPIERIVIVPCAELAALPFEALVVASEQETPASFADLTFVIDRYELTYGPSSPVLIELAAMGSRPASGKVLLLADPRYAGEPPTEADDEPAAVAATALLGERGQRAPPDPETLARLPKTREEALAVAERLGVDDDEAELALARMRRKRSGALASERFDLFLGADASRARLKGDLRGYAVLHFACHGLVDPEFPQRTGIALAFDEQDPGWFTILDALELDLDANLVVLSACETALGEAKVGEGVESLARAFLYSGARAVIASLWQVSDWAAAETMEAFYAGSLEQGLAPARALREAKLALRRSRALRGTGIVTSGRVSSTLESGHPFFWAPFIHVGHGHP